MKLKHKKVSAIRKKVKELSTSGWLMRIENWKCSVFKKFLFSIWIQRRIEIVENT
jgi:hypothetical protein